jgi:hypothetical protein
MFFVLPGDATYLDICNYLILKLQFDISTIVGIVGSAILTVILIVFTKIHNKILLLILPYSLMAIFSIFVYFNTHHIGTITLFFLFVIWCCVEDKEEKNITFKCLKSLIKKDSDIILLKRIPKIFFAIVIFISIVWTIVSSVNEIYTPYGEGRDLAKFIKANNLDEYKIMAKWKEYTNNETNETVLDTNLINTICTLPYFDRNIFYNFNTNMPNKCYIIHKVGNNYENIKEWNKIGTPDVIIGDVNLNTVFDDSINYNDYICVYDAKGSFIWKSEVVDYGTLVYIRKELMNQFPNLKELSIDSYRMNRAYNYKELLR